MTVNHTPISIYIISGGAGASGEQLVHTVLAQFPENKVSVITAAHVRRTAQLEEIIFQAAKDNAIIVHTMIDAHLRNTLQQLAEKHQVVAIDLMGNLMTHLSEALGQEPVEKPGLYRQLNRDYFERVAAIDFTMAHDDGKNPNGWSQAEIVLTGVSRVGKTPLSMYLAVLGWKVANVPLVPTIPPPLELFHLDPKRVIGLTIDPTKLLMHRQQRQRRLGKLTGVSPYSDPVKLFEEVETADRIFARGGFSVIDVTDKPIEASADDVIKLITRHTEGKHKRSTGLP